MNEKYDRHRQIRDGFTFTVNCDQIKKQKRKEKQPTERKKTFDRHHNKHFDIFKMITIQKIQERTFLKKKSNYYGRILFVKLQITDSLSLQE